MNSLIRTLALAMACAIAHSQTLPGASQDRVGYPEGYRDSFTLLYAFDPSGHQENSRDVRERSGRIGSAR